VSSLTLSATGKGKGWPLINNGLGFEQVLELFQRMRQAELPKPLEGRFHATDQTTPRVFI